MLNSTGFVIHETQDEINVQRFILSSIMEKAVKRSNSPFISLQKLIIENLKPCENDVFIISS